ncbi:MAG: molybdopterin cofactor-binding domain-containing protein, partial [Eubacteriales bacterium]
NLTTGGVMRGYGIPQVDFAMECMMDDLALQLSIDPIDFRLKNCMQPGYEDPHTHIKYRGNGLEQCIAIGREKIGWDEKRKSYANQTGRVRRGVGVAIFNYKTGVYPISLETASCRMILNQDGSMQIQLGATEIGQGADTVFTQMTAEITGITEDRIHIISTQDTDVTPFDTGAYASRQSYVTGKAVKKTGLLFKDKILTFAREIREIGDAPLEIVENRILNADGTELMTLEELGMEAMYSLSCSQHITAETTSHCTDNSFATGATFVEVEVDIPLGKVKVLNIINIHDSGTLLNPKLAISQVHGGMSMGLGYVLGEELLFDAKGKPLNDNLLDYKLPTALDTPELQTDFVEQYDESGPFGNKALGEPPTISQAPAIRNAVLHATGVAFDSLPLNPEKLVLTFLEKGLIKGGDTHV